MKLWLPMGQGRKLFAPNDGNESAGGAGAQYQTEENTAVKDNVVKESEKKAPETIPYERFAEVNSKKNELESQLAAYKQKEAEELEKKKKADEDEAKKKGEYEKLIQQKDQELADYKKKQETWAKREESVTANNNSRIESLKAKLGENWKTAESLITEKTDPFELADALDAIEKLHGKEQTPKGGSSVPDGNGTGRLTELKEIVNKGGRLSSGELDEYFKLVNDLENK